MGGNRKQANRTKNNARPANSGRSAELLGNTPPPFVGFSTVKDGAFVTVLPGFSTNVDDINPNLDPNFQLLLKKMNKKDSTTKLKALQEFSELVRTSEVEAVKAILPFWPRLYCQLATDVEHRVREALHQTQRVVVSKAKRNIAPFLKQLAGPWFTSQYDTYAPAATAAQLSFQEAFPPNKQLEAIAFCQEEILAYITDNLVVQTAQTLCNSKAMEAEQMAARHERVLSCSLHGYVLYLRRLPPDTEGAPGNAALLSSPRFWKLSGHPAPQVRGAWLSAIAALCERRPALVAGEVPRSVCATLARLDEADPSVAPLAWEAALHVVSAVPEWWRHVNVDKAVLPKVSQLVRQGGRGSAAAVFPSLLPLLGGLPEGAGGGPRALYDRLFADMRAGFSRKGVAPSRSESGAVARCYAECLQFAAGRGGDAGLGEHLVTEQLVPALRLALTDPQLGHLSEALFEHASLLAQRWDRNAGDEHLLAALWPALLEEALACEAPDRPVALCLALRRPPAPPGRRRVKFGAEVPDGAEAPDGGGATPSPGYVEALSGVAVALLGRHLHEARAGRDAGRLRALPPLAAAFPSPEALSAFLDLPEGGGAGAAEALRHHLGLWLEGDEDGVEATADMALVLTARLETRHREAVMAVIAEALGGPGAAPCLAAALRHRRDAAVASLLREEGSRGALAAVARSCRDPPWRPRRWALLREACLARDADGDFVVGDGTFREGVVSALEGDGASPALLAALADLTFGERLGAGAAGPSLVRLLGAAREAPELTPSARAGAAALARAGHLDATLGHLAEFARRELGNIAKSSCATSGGQEADIEALASAVSGVLGAAGGATSGGAVEAARRFLGACRPDAEALAPVLSRLAAAPGHRELAASRACRDPGLPGGATLDEALALHLAWLHFHFSLLDRLASPPGGSGRPREDEGEEGGEAAEEVAPDAATGPGEATQSAFRPLAPHVAALAECLEACSAFALRFSSAAYSYRISTRLAALSPVCARLGAWEALRVGERALRAGVAVADGPLALPWQEPAKWPPTEVGAPTAELLLCWPGLAASVRDPSDPVVVLEALASTDRASLLFECDATGRPDSDLAAVATAADFVSRCVASLYARLPPPCVDFAAVALASWCRTLYLSRGALLAPSPRLPASPGADGRDPGPPHGHGVAALAEAVCALYATFLPLVRGDEERAREWGDVFGGDADEAVVGTFLTLAEWSCSHPLCLLHLPALEALSAALQHVTHACATPAAQLASCLACKGAPLAAAQLGAFRVARRLAVAVAAQDGAGEEEAPALCGALLPHLGEARTVVEAALGGVRAGASCLVAPHTDAASYALALLLLWDVALEACSAAESGLRARYARALREGEHVDGLIRAVFRLMPEEVLSGGSHGKGGRQRGKTPDLFCTPPRLHLGRFVSSGVVERSACWVYWVCVRRLPAEVRQCWKNGDPRLFPLVDRVTAAHVSPALCDLEMRTLRAHVAADTANVQIRVHPSVSEVHAVYTVDEVRLELAMSLPLNYPLTPVAVDTASTERLHDPKEGRGWLMQLRMFLAHQNGSLWEGLSLWKANLDRRFDGVEECCICYSVMHGSSLELPRLACRTCRKKFHRVCMYKWINTSTKSTCPICRNLF